MANSEKEVIKNMLSYIMSERGIPSRELINEGRLDLLVEWYLFQPKAINANPDIKELPNEISYYIQKINQLTGTNFENNLKVEKLDALYSITDGNNLVITINPRDNTLDAEHIFNAYDTQARLFFKTEDDALDFADAHDLPIKGMKWIQKDSARNILGEDKSLLKYLDNCYISTENTHLSTLNNWQWRELFNLNA